MAKMEEVEGEGMEKMVEVKGMEGVGMQKMVEVKGMEGKGIQKMDELKEAEGKQTSTNTQNTSIPPGVLSFQVVFLSTNST